MTKELSSRGIVRSVKCPVRELCGRGIVLLGELSSPGIVRSGNCLVGELSGRGIVCQEIVQSGNCPDIMSMSSTESSFSIISNAAVDQLIH